MLELAVCRGLAELKAVMPGTFLERLTMAAAEMGERPGYQDRVSPLAICRSTGDALRRRTAEYVEHWRALIHLLVTPSKRDWRKGFNASYMGFEVEQGG